MASEVDICNLALGRLGDDATVSSLNPPEGSVQAEKCAKFYPIARDSLLEMHQWGFATRRTNPPMLENVWPEWKFTYAVPNDALNIIAVMPPNATSDYTFPEVGWPSGNVLQDRGMGHYTPQPFETEIAVDGTQIILTNQENAMLRYTSLVKDTNKFSPLFVDCLGWLLGSYLAGPLLKGDVGRAAAKDCLGAFGALKTMAVASDVAQRKIELQQSVNWINNR